MKNSIKLLMFSAALVSFSVLSSCGSKKNDNPYGDVDINEPCQGIEYSKNSNGVFKASGYGESENRNIAEKRALILAKNKLAGNIETKIKSVTDQYVKSNTLGNKEESMDKLEAMAREVISQSLQGINITCQKLRQSNKTGNYKFYVAIELSSADILKNYNKALSENESLKVDYNYEKFKDTFNEEMSKMDKN